MSDKKEPVPLDSILQQLHDLIDRASDPAHEDRELINELLETFYLSFEEHQRLLVEAHQNQHEALANSEVLQTMINTMPIGAIITDSQGQNLTANQAAKEILGSEISGPLESPVRSYTPLHPDGRAFQPEEFPLHRALQEVETIRDVEMVIEQENGEMRTILANAAPVIDQEGKMSSAIATFQDVSEDLQTKKELKKLHKKLHTHADDLESRVKLRTAALETSQARFKSIFEQSMLGIALLDQEGKLLMANPYLRDLTGMSKTAMETKFLADLFQPDDHPLSEIKQSLLSEDVEHFQTEKRLISNNRTDRWISLTISRIESPELGSASQFLAAMKDITEERKAQQAVIQSEKLALAGRLSASLAHEINNPLQVVIGFLGLIEESLENGSEARHYLDIAAEELEKAAGVVNQLRDLNRKPKIQDKVELDLVPIIDNAVVLTRKRSQDGGVKINWDPPSDLPQIPLVAELFSQVIINIILNALDAMPEGGKLAIEARSTTRPDGIQIDFSDTGVGIEPEQETKIFEPFYTTRADGMGMGLYICQRIIESHSGRLTVESNHQGTTFSVWLPVSEDGPRERD